MASRAIATSEEWVAIVDDDESIRRSLVRLLRLLGIRAETFETGDQYLGHVLSPPRCLLVDVQLGTSTGFELLDRLASLGPVVPPIIFISAYDDPATLQRALASGAQGFLRKPFSAAALLELITPFVFSQRTNRSNERADVSMYTSAGVAGRDC